jgi:Fe-S-cluster containining protein
MGCTGACCVAFPLGGNLAAWPGLSARGRLWVDEGVNQGLDILAMVIPLTHEETLHRGRRFGLHGFGPLDEPDPAREYFRCIHWDEQTRLCGNYEHRPEMCRAYPYGEPCEHGCDADWDHAPRVWEGDYA